jgi:hypothetical protein
MSSLISQARRQAPKERRLTILWILVTGCRFSFIAL